MGLLIKNIINKEGDGIKIHHFFYGIGKITDFDYSRTEEKEHKNKP